MMRKAMLWGAAVAVALTSIPAAANVVVVKSLGPSAKAYPPGKTLPETAKINLQGDDVLNVPSVSSSAAHDVPEAPEIPKSSTV